MGCHSQLSSIHRACRCTPRRLHARQVTPLRRPATAEAARRCAGSFLAMCVACRRAPVQGPQGPWSPISQKLSLQPKGSTRSAGRYCSQIWRASSSGGSPCASSPPK